MSTGQCVAGLVGGSHSEGRVLIHPGDSWRPLKVAGCRSLERQVSGANRCGSGVFSQRQGRCGWGHLSPPPSVRACPGPTRGAAGRGSLEIALAKGSSSCKLMACGEGSASPRQDAARICRPCVPSSLPMVVPTCHCLDRGRRKPTAHLLPSVARQW